MILEEERRMTVAEIEEKKYYESLKTGGTSFAIRGRPEYNVYPHSSILLTPVGAEFPAGRNRLENGNQAVQLII